MARKAGQLIARGQSTWLVRVYLGRDSPRNGFLTGFTLKRRREESFSQAPNDDDDRQNDLRLSLGLVFRFAR